MAVGTEKTFPSVTRMTDVTSPESMVFKTLGPRKFSSAEVMALCTDILRVEGFLSILSDWIVAHKTGANALGKIGVDNVEFNVLVAEPGATINIGQLVVTGARLLTKQSTVALTDAGVGENGTFTLAYAGQTIFTITGSSYVLHAALRALPAAAYHAIGSLLEELAASYYKGEGPREAITSVERAAIIRLQDKITKSMIEQASTVSIGTKNGLVCGPDLYVGTQLARQNSQTLIRALAPILGAWIFDESPLGEQLVTAASVN